MKFKLPKTSKPNGGEMSPPKPAPPARRRRAPPLPIPKRTKAQVPGLWQRGLAGVSMTKTRGPGEKLLDEVCRENNWTWGIVATYCDGKDLRTSVLVGVVLDAGAEQLIENQNTHAWDEVDLALGEIARRLEEGEDGGEG